jgi:CDP-glucose 4,6-dehydratase
VVSSVSGRFGDGVLNSYWAGRTVLVTGYGGFLGGWTARTLAQRSARVIGLVHRSMLHPVGNVSIKIAHGDIRDISRLRTIFEQHPIDTVFHLAAQTLPTLAREAPDLTFEVNTLGAWTLLEAARTASRIPAVVIGSTDSVYGENDGTPFTEDSNLAPHFPYETSKACAEMVAGCYVQTYRLPIVIARFCNLYGPGDVTESRLMAGAIEAALAGRRQQLRGDGSAIRNYLYIEDAVSALLLLAESLDRLDLAGQAFNFCDERPWSVLDIVNRILAVAGCPDLKPRLGRGTPGEISVKRASAAKAHAVLGWRPAIDLDEGLARTIAWHCARHSAVEPQQ